MRYVFFRSLLGLTAVVLVAGTASFAQQPADPFRWMDFHSPKDQSVIVWVTRALEPEKWTAIREIGVEYDAALVVTTLRAAPQAPANADTFSVWSVSLTNHQVTPLLTGVNLRWLDWMRFAEGKSLEPAIVYSNCRECAADTYFTAFRYDVPRHAWAARWMRGGEGVPIWSDNPPEGVSLTQISGGMADPNGREYVGTWNHFDYGKLKPPEDYVYLYDLDTFSGLERTQLLNGPAASTMEQRLCGAQISVAGLAHGQDSWLCHQTVHPNATRKPVTTPPADNHGQSVPPGTKPRH
jgi:hypothetical protein